jgi:hypothetical protein
MTNQYKYGREKEIVVAKRLRGSGAKRAFFFFFYFSISLKTFSIAGFSSGKRSLIVSHTTSNRIPKYSWISLSLIPAIAFHGTSGYLFLTPSGTCFAASP